MTAMLAVTLGNTSIAIAGVDEGGVLADVCREPLERLEAVFTEWLEALPDGEVTVIVCSVSPPAMARLREAAEAARDARVHEAGKDFHIAVKADVEEPQRVGTDRLLAALAAHRRVGGACIVVDAGTAVTVDAVDDDGTFLGGAIFPGPGLMARALAEGTAQLPHVELRSAVVPETVVGKNSEEAIRSGIANAFAGGIRNVAAAIAHETGVGMPVIVTGGYAPKGDADSGPWTVVPDLVLEGLVLAWRERTES